MSHPNSESWAAFDEQPVPAAAPSHPVSPSRVQPASTSATLRPAVAQQQPHYSAASGGFQTGSISPMGPVLSLPPPPPPPLLYGPGPEHAAPIVAGPSIYIAQPFGAVPAAPATAMQGMPAAGPRSSAAEGVSPSALPFNPGIAASNAGPYGGLPGSELPAGTPGYHLPASVVAVPGSLVQGPPLQRPIDMRIKTWPAFRPGVWFRVVRYCIRERISTGGWILYLSLMGIVCLALILLLLPAQSFAITFLSWIIGSCLVKFLMASLFLSFNRNNSKQGLLPVTGNYVVGVFGVIVVEIAWILISALITIMLIVLLLGAPVLLILLYVVVVLVLSYCITCSLAFALQFLCHFPSIGGWTCAVWSFAIFHRKENFLGNLMGVVIVILLNGIPSAMVQFSYRDGAPMAVSAALIIWTMAVTQIYGLYQYAVALDMVRDNMSESLEGSPVAAALASLPAGAARSPSAAEAGVPPASASAAAAASAVGTGATSASSAGHGSSSRGRRRGGDASSDSDMEEDDRARARRPPSGPAYTTLQDI